VNPTNSAASDAPTPGVTSHTTSVTPAATGTWFSRWHHVYTTAPQQHLVEDLLTSVTPLPRPSHVAPAA
jgi:hypothetical protein